MRLRALAAPAVAALAMTACSGDGAATTTRPGPVATTAAATTSTAAPVTTVPLPTTTVSTAPPATTTTAAPATTTPATTEPPGPAELPTIPVGPDGIEYRGGGDDLERTGPSLLAVAPDGGIHFVDPVGGRIWSFTAGGTTTIDLAVLDIASVTALAAGPGGLVVVEIFFAPERNRVHRIGYDGTLLETIELPEGFRLEDGLSGVFTGPDDEIALEFEGGARFGVWDEAAGAFHMETTLTLGDTTVSQQGEDLEINGTLVTSDLQGFGGSRYLGTATDGTVVTVRDDVLATTPAFVVLTTVEWYSAQGAFLGSARVPSIDEQYIDTPPGLAITPDGRVLALVAREDTVAVIELDRLDRRITDIEDAV